MTDVKSIMNSRRLLYYIAARFIHVSFPEEQFEALFVHFPAPLGSPALLSESEAVFLVEMSCSLKTLKGPEVYALMAPVSAEVDGRAHEAIAKILAAPGIAHDEPSEMAPPALAVDPINGNGPLDLSRPQDTPETVSSLVISPKKF